MSFSEQFEIIKHINGSTNQVLDQLAIEEPLQISLTVNKKNKSTAPFNLAITMRTPGHDPELALGFLYSEGIINQFDEVLQIDEKENEVHIKLADANEENLKKLSRNFYTTSSCGICGKTSIEAIHSTKDIPTPLHQISIQASIIKSLPKTLREKQNVFESTGGLHAVGLFNLEGVLIHLHEDIGRHNAMDKIIGSANKSKLLPLDKHIVLLSGRASFELIQKAALAGIQIIAAIGAPSTLAVQLAKEFDITLIGFLKDSGFNIYHAENRIIF